MGDTLYISPLNFSSHFAANTSGFNVNWMLHQNDHEVSSTQQDVALIRNETPMFLMPPQLPHSTRQQRGSQVGFAALATVEFFG